MRTQIFEDKRLNATTQQCVHRMKTILNLVHIDISKDEAIYAPLICYSKLQHFVQNTAIERSLSVHCYAQLNSHIWCEFDTLHTFFSVSSVYLYFSFGKGRGM